MNHILKIHPSVDGHWVCLYSLTVVNNVIVNTDITTMCFHLFPVDTEGALLGHVVTVLFEELTNFQGG